VEGGQRAVEALVSATWSGRRVLVTGHTGFKGGWLSLWLHALGAEVTGFALPAPTEPSLFEAARIDALLSHVEGDVREMAAVRACVDGGCKARGYLPPRRAAAGAGIL
jgi:CDP-glucose 4,6-dehydratase